MTPESHERWRQFMQRITVLDPVAADLGPGGTTLLTALSLAEVEADYAGPVFMWDFDLIQQLAFRSPTEFTNAVGKAVEAGWLEVTKSTSPHGSYYRTILKPLPAPRPTA